MNEISLLFIAIIIIAYYVFKLYGKDKTNNKLLTNSNLEVEIILDLNYNFWDYNDSNFLTLKTFSKEIYKFSELDICKKLDISEHDRVLHSVKYIINNGLCNCKITYFSQNNLKINSLEENYSRNIVDGDPSIFQSIKLIENNKLSPDFVIRINELGLLELGISKIPVHLYNDLSEEVKNEVFVFLGSQLIIYHDNKEKILKFINEKKVYPLLENQGGEFTYSGSDYVSDGFIDFFGNKNYLSDDFISYSNKCLTIKYKQSFYNQD